MLGPVIGAVLGGFIAERAGWRWIFWVLFAACATCTAAIMLFTRETYGPVILRREPPHNGIERKRDLLTRGIMRPLRMLIRSPILLILSVYISFVFSLLFLLFTTIASLFTQVYGWSIEQSGLSYLGLGLGNAAGLVIFAKTSDATVARLTRANNGVYEPEMRLAPALISAFFIPVSLFWYGWSAEAHTHWIVPIISLVPFGIGVVGAFASAQSYIIDSAGPYAASAVAALTVLSTAETASIEKQVRPYLNADAPWEGDFFPPETRRVMGLAGKSREYIEKIPGNPLYRGVCDALLTSKFTSWNGQKRETSISKPQLNNTIVFSINPGARAQDLHRDDMVHHNFQPAITHQEYRAGRDTGIGFFVAGKRTTKANGATRFVPGSHLQATDMPPNEADAVYAELEPGDAFIMLSSCYHGGSANTTENEERLIYSCFMTKGFLRQEENQYLASPIEKVKEYPVDLQEMIGYQISKPFLGWVELNSPRKLLLNENEVMGGQDLF
ncbi:Phytanoyl- dioxygenase [Neofusicoccum parvum]|uniref:Phytanoyl- dioxygenase n=1 Tax=Neofusicoccum parvum TaxID=310453 RepID=A0ACB5S4W7_9PEZI|nr:Phytanoyl- dioxygenase [Neofusicoccum parvum]